MFCSSSSRGGKNLFCAGGGGGRREQVDNGDDSNSGAGYSIQRRRMINNNDGMGAGIMENNNSSVYGGGGGRRMLDDVVVNALKNLNFEDLQRNLNEQHGVRDHFKESPEFLANKFHELEAELNRQARLKMMESLTFVWMAPSESSSSSPPGILLAKSMDPNFVQNTYRLRLRVLRAEFYDAAKAAARMIRYFELKKEVFGSERICKNITFDDLNPDDILALNKGFFQYIQGRDSVGHRIIALFPCIVEPKDPKSMPRLFFYYDTFVNQNKYDKGYILLVFKFGPPSQDALDLQNRVVRLKESLIGYPDSPSAIHTCFHPNDSHHLFHQAVFLLMPPEVRAKIKIHVGSPTEWLYELMGYGISQHLVPISSSRGEIKFNQHQAFTKYRKKLETLCAIDPTFNVIEIPNSDDVLFVKSRHFQHQKGNSRLHFLIDENSSRYDSCTTSKDKSKVIAEITKEIMSVQGSRFLIQDMSMVWVETDDTTIKKKLGHMFRNVRKKATTATTTTRTPCSTIRTTLSPWNDTDLGGVLAVSSKKPQNQDDHGDSSIPKDNNKNGSISAKRPSPSQTLPDDTCSIPTKKTK